MNDKAYEEDILLDMALAHMRELIDKAEAALKDEHEKNLRDAMAELANESEKAYQFILSW